jgi:predicted amidohydrolase
LSNYGGRERVRERSGFVSAEANFKPAAINIEKNQSRRKLVIQIRKMKTSNGSKGHMYVPVIFPPCTDIYFISKNIDSMSFYNPVREDLIKIIGRNLISMYDTCGFNPLLLIVTAESPSTLDSFIDSARESGINIHPTYMAFTASPKSIIKRFGMVVDQADGKEWDILDKIRKNPVILDLLEYITADKLKPFDSEHSEEERDASIKKEIEDVKKKITKELIKEIKTFGMDISMFKKEEELLEKVEDAQKYLNEKFIKYIPLVNPPNVPAMIFLRFPIKLQYLFSWDNVPGNANEKLIRFLRDDLDIGWEENAKIVKSDDGKTLRIFKDKKSAEIKLDEVNEKAILKISDGRTRVLKVKKENGELNIYYLFCEKLYDKNIQTIMKCVLRTWKEEGWEPAEPKFPVTPHLKLEKGLQERVLRILCDENKSDILKADTGDQCGLITDDLRKLGFVRIKITDVSEALKKVRKEVIYRTSVKLERMNWLKTMIFITAARGRKREVELDINTMFLGVDEITFARKYYHVTGIVDFIVLLDCTDLSALKKKIRKFTEYCGDKIREIRIYFELADGDEKIHGLTPRVLARINSLIPNSGNFNETEYGTLKVGEDYPTRHNYYEWEIKNRKKKIDELCELDSDTAKGDETDSEHPDKITGLIPVSEINPDVMIHAYVRFKFSISKEREFREELEIILKNGQHPFLKKYDTIQDHTVVECIIVTKDFKSLFDFVKRLDQYCKLSEVNLIFHQKFFKPAIPEGLRCKPCRLPVGEPCDACEFYTSKRTMTTIRTRNFGIKTMKKCRIAIVQIKITATGSETWLSKAKDDKNHKDKICGYIKDAIKEGANIIVFPELTIPKELIDDIKRVIAEESKAQRGREKIFVIAGSHYKCYKEQQEDNPYNVSPIILYEEGKTEVYEQQKNIPGITHNAKERDISNAKGILRFSNTGFGDFAVLLCRDILEKPIIDELFNMIDIVICPAGDDTFGRENETHRTIQMQIDGYIKQRSIFTVMANNGIYGGSGVYGPFIAGSREAEKLETMIIQKDEEKMEIYKINIMDLDKNRGGGDDRDRKYLAMPNAKRRHEDKIEVYEITSEDILKFTPGELISKLAERTKISVDTAEKVVQDCLEWIDAKIKTSGLNLTEDAKHALLATVVLAMKKTDEFLKDEIEVYEDKPLMKIVKQEIGGYPGHDDRQ